MQKRLLVPTLELRVELAPLIVDNPWQLESEETRTAWILKLLMHRFRLLTEPSR